MKRVNNLFEKIISEDNIRQAINEVNKSHRWASVGKPNKKVLWVETTKEERIKELRQIILNGFIPKPTISKRRWDSNAKKWRDINEPSLYPDQYVHHALIQVLEPVMMRGMDKYCCGSIKGRGAIYGVNAIKKWMKYDNSGTRWCAELDIYHFYEQLTPEVVLNRFRKLVKDRKTLDLIERVLINDITIGAYFSQWFANTVLQELDHKLRESGIGIKHYLRYIDNITIFSNRKRSIIKAIQIINKWLASHGMRLNSKRQYFRTKKRLPSALGYRYGKGFTLIRKGVLLNIKRQIASYERKKRKGTLIPVKFAQSLLSRIGRLTHCNCYNIRNKYIRKGLIKELKNIVRNNARRNRLEWSTCLEIYRNMKLSEQNHDLMTVEI